MNPGVTNALLTCLGILCLLFVLEIIIHRSFEAAIKALKSAFKAELKSDCGRVNAVVAFIMLLAFLFTHLEDVFIRALAKAGALPPGRESAVSPLLLGVFLMGSVFFVGLLEGTKALSSARRERAGPKERS